MLAVLFLTKNPLTKLTINKLLIMNDKYIMFNINYGNVYLENKCETIRLDTVLKIERAT